MENLQWRFPWICKYAIGAYMGFAIRPVEETARFRQMTGRINSPGRKRFASRARRWRASSVRVDGLVEQGLAMSSTTPIVTFST
jgi:hypothetical protein